MNRRILAAAMLILTGCASGGGISCIDIVPPKIELTGEKTALERQVIGEYKELEEDAWIISSVQTNVAREQRNSQQASADQILFEAFKIREYHSEKIREYKNEGVIGEKSNGFIEYISFVNRKYENDKQEKNLITALIDEENKARYTIFRRSLVLSGIENPDEAQIRAFGEDFAVEQRSSALKDDYIQNRNGIWELKK
ncbi:MAG: DUF1318 domain-containing protein [Spirochaetes bacterium]|nr:DUF1318 domain-containing protein [Spirochaetota bacterium]